MVRFFSDGPDIPDRLIEARDQGKVVFLCGAGISVPSKLPDFLRLTWKVIECLHAVSDPEILNSFKFREDGSDPACATKPFDQIFQFLEENYRRDAIDRYVAKQLKTTMDGPPSREHGIVVRISTNTEGNPQIVTTNFDRLFEHPGVANGINFSEPPFLPDPLQDQSISGIIYLHGRLRSHDTAPQNFVLSRSDFAQAYMIDGHATKFLQNLLDKYTVVLLGYRAKDPLVEYLLQGLGRTAALDPNRLYAFDRDVTKDMEAKWKALGVTPIAYSGDGSDHSRLWDSLYAWATRADDPATLRSEIIEMARRGPRVLPAHERGQVVNIVCSMLGAKTFADANPVPPAEWLCVFDNHLRLARPLLVPGLDDEFSPRDHYALDDDPAELRQEYTRPETEEPTESLETVSRPDVLGEDLISWSIDDDVRPMSEFRRSGRFVGEFEELPPRLHHLCRWIARNSLDPIAAWWAARQYRLHPSLVSMISKHIETAGDVFDLRRHVWKLIFEAHERNDEDLVEKNRDDLQRSIAHEDWTPRTLRALQKFTEPFIKIDLISGRSQIEPPSASSSDLMLSDIAHFKVVFPNQKGEPLDVPDSAVCAAFSLASRNLIVGIERLIEVGNAWYRTYTLYPDECIKGHIYRSPEAKFVIWITKLMCGAARLDPERVSEEISLWPKHDRIVLNKLKLFAWKLPEVFSGDQVVSNMMEMDHVEFWNSADRREFLILLRDRWKDIPDQGKTRLLDRLLAGREIYPEEEPSEYPEHRDCDIVKRIRWLEQQGCALPGNIPQLVAEVQARLPKWNDECASKAARSWERPSGFVVEDRNASMLVDLPLSSVVETALERTCSPSDELRKYNPFEGLVQEHPTKALSALGYAARKGLFPHELWGAIIREWPVSAPARATRLFYERVRRLPNEVIIANAHKVSYWVKEKLPAIALDDESFALAIFDDLLARLFAGGEETTRSGILDDDGSGRIVERSRRTIDHAVGTPVGYFTCGLLTILDARKFPQGHGIPLEFETRLESLLSAPGEGSDHAICMVAQQLTWLQRLDPRWVKARMVPLFVLDNPSSEPAWNGLLRGRSIVGPDLFEDIGAHFLELFDRMYDWHWDDGEYENSHIWLVISTVRHKHDPRYTSLKNAAAAIRKLPESGRCDVIHELARIGQDMENGWADAVVPFLDDLWPRHKGFQTDQVLTAFLSLIYNSGDAFPIVLKVARDFLHPSRQGNHSLYRFYRVDFEDEEPFASRFPKETLELMHLIVADDQQVAPHELGKVLGLVSETRPELTGDWKFIRLQRLVT